MNDFLQFVLSGLTIGSIYAIVALGFVTIYNVTHVINMAQGEFVMLGAMVFWSFLQLHVSYFLAAVITVILVALVGFITERWIIRPAEHFGPIKIIILTIGLSMAIRSLASIIWGKSPESVPPITNQPPIVMGQAVLPWQSMWVMILATSVVILLFVFMQYTVTGKSFQAVAFNKKAARLIGIRPERMMRLSFVIAGAVGALAGIAIAPITNAAYDMGLMIGIKGFAATIFGGLGSAPGAILGGLLIGLLEAFSAGYISSGFKDALAFVVVLSVLIVRPRGLISEKTLGRGGL